MVPESELETEVELIMLEDERSLVTVLVPSLVLAVGELVLVVQRVLNVLVH